MYEYTPLDSSTTTIRLVILLPGEFGEDVECTLLHVPLDTELSYEALSYTWGDPKMLHPILLDDQTFPVTENLYDALRHLRLKNDQARYLWIDALCIDQANDREKSVQVQRMKKIYEQASRVLMWLGPSSEDSDMAMDLIAGDVTVGSEDAILPQEFSYALSDTEMCSGTPNEFSSGGSKFNDESGVAISSRQLLEDDEYFITDTRHVEVSEPAKAEYDTFMNNSKVIIRKDEFVESRPTGSAEIPLDDKTAALKREKLTALASNSNSQVAMWAKQMAALNRRSRGSRDRARAWKALFAFVCRPHWSPGFYKRLQSPSPNLC
jgi:Heterokaryon incompatibility protein (HET)